jgi:SAM-dependent methyltransferase
LDIPAEMRQLYEAEASNYDKKYDTDARQETLDLYVQELDTDLGATRGRKALDVGAGTGFLTGILLKSAYDAYGVDFSQAMLAIAKATYPLGKFERRDAESDGAAYADSSFDLIISRQVVGHFLDPIAAFRNWHHWLTSGGHAAVIDAFWSRADWSGNWSKFVDHLPLACTDSWAPVSYLLRQAGFSIKTARLLDRVNADECQRSSANGMKPKVRYMVVAQKI